MNNTNTISNKKWTSVRSAAYLMLLIFWATGLGLAQGNSPKAKAPGVLRFHLELNRMVPSTLTVVEGDYILRVSSGVITSDVEFQIDDDKGNKNAAASLKDRKVRAHIPVTLKVGHYVLRVPGVDRLKCDITVTPAK